MDRIAIAGIAAGVVVWLASPGASAQQQAFTPATLPGSVDRTPAVSPMLLVIPEPEIFRGVELNAAQRTALSDNLRKAKFELAAQKSIDPAHVAAQRLPSGQTLNTMQFIGPLPGGLAAGDPCAMPDFSDEQVAALRTVLARQLQSQAGDVDGFRRNEPTGCRRTQMLYLMKSAQVVAR
jgi:hypothetical protein